MKKIILIGLSLLFFITVFAQQETNNNTKIAGKVFDSSSRLPLDYATITLFVKGSKKPLTGTTAGHSGEFEITVCRWEALRLWLILSVIFHLRLLLF